MGLIYLHTEIHMLVSNDSLVAATKTSHEYRFYAATFLLFAL
jgi:hypothetical protein